MVLAGAARSQDADRIVGAALNRRGAISFLETLTDTVGGRVTGSPESRAASELVLRTLREAGLANAHLEEYTIVAGWKRGPASARVTSPVNAPIHLGSYGWAPGIRMEVPLASATATAEGSISPDPARLRGFAVLVALESGTDLTLAPNYVVMRSRTARRLAAAGAAAMLIPSEKPGGMLYTSAAGLYPRAPLPVLSVAKEDALLLRRLLGRGDVRLSLDVENRFEPGPVPERNVVAEIRGTDPRAAVLLGAHFDSWDLAQGATDNGAGVAAMLDAARILQSLGTKPRATIRFAFFSGEEQACLGSRAWADAHRPELDHLWAALIMDGEPQAPLGFTLHGREDLAAAIQQRLSPLAGMGAAAIDAGGDLVSDDQTFVVYGIPTLSLKVADSDADVRHHTVVDTFDKVDPRWLALDTAALALAAWSLANAEVPPGPRLPTPEVKKLLEKTRQAEYVALDYASLP
ncbi:MAG: M20/M25/M40 family metallo-hydrolase [Myxococcales bacterium]|nr:M20/M25/M40 family metallo-hydrolase [Myxococcales bacterium]